MAFAVGTRGSEVVKLQKQLNSLGANLKVNGVWSKGTQTAYDKYAKQLIGAGASKLPGVSKLEYAPTPEKEKVKAAESRYNPVYDSAKAELNTGYSQAYQRNEDQAIKRGVARSSYLQDVQTALGAKHAESSSKLEGERAAQIQAMVAQLTQSDRVREADTAKYNNDLALKLSASKQKEQQAQAQLDYKREAAKEQAKVKQAAEKVKQMNSDRNYKLAVERLNLAKQKAAGGSGSSSGAKKSGGAKKSSGSGKKSSGSKQPTGNNSGGARDYYKYYLEHYAKPGTDAAGAEQKYAADRANVMRTMGQAAVEALDRAAQQYRKAGAASPAAIAAAARK